MEPEVQVETPSNNGVDSSKDSKQYRSGASLARETLKELGIKTHNVEIAKTIQDRYNILVSGATITAARINIRNQESKRATIQRAEQHKKTRQHVEIKPKESNFDNISACFNNNKVDLNNLINVIDLVQQAMKLVDDKNILKKLIDVL